VLGAQLKDVADFNLKHMGLVVERNGHIIDTAAGAAVMGHPALSVAWLANKMGEYGIALKKGEIILSGSLVKAVECKPGDVFVATFDRLGSVKTVFTEG
jgi:2-keto-4-pentenoate hydratase